MLKDYIREYLLKTVYFSISTFRAIKTICRNATKIHKNGFKSLFWYVDPMFMNVGLLEKKIIYRMTKSYKLPRCKYLRGYIYQTNPVYKLINLIK